MQAGVHAHVPITAIPVDPGLHPVALAQDPGLVGPTDMENGSLLSSARVNDVHDWAVDSHQLPAISRLAASLRIKYGGVKHDRTINYRQNPGFAVPAIGIILKQQSGRHHCARDR